MTFQIALKCCTETLFLHFVFALLLHGKLLFTVKNKSQSKKKGSAIRYLCSHPRFYLMTKQQYLMKLLVNEHSNKGI